MLNRSYKPIFIFLITYKNYNTKAAILAVGILAIKTFLSNTFLAMVVFSITKNRIQEQKLYQANYIYLFFFFYLYKLKCKSRYIGSKGIFI